MSTPSTGLREALLQLDRARKDRPAIKGPTDFFSEVLPRLFEKECSDPLPLISAEKAVAKLAEGIPLLRGEPVEIDSVGFRHRWLAIAEAVERHQDSKSGKSIALALQKPQWNEIEITTAALSGSPENLHTCAEGLSLEPDLMGTMVRLCLFPVLARWNADLNPAPPSLLGKRAGGLGCDHGYCPTCGSWPLLGEFRGLEQIRWLRCGWCAAEWKVPRLFCPFCENGDHRSLGYLSVDGDGSKYRINTCEKCHCYLKMISTLSPLSPPQLLAADVATVHLDLAAAEKAYATGSNQSSEIKDQ